jgi:PhnB protein
MPKAIPDGYHAVTPSFAFKDSRQAIAFYEKAFGAKQIMLMPSPGGKGVMHAEIRIGDSAIMLTDESLQMRCKSAETLGESPITIYLYVENVDQFVKRAADAGAKLEYPVMDMFWGDRMGVLKDPFGYTWTVATHTRDMTPEEMAKGAEAFAAQMANK